PGGFETKYEVVKNDYNGSGENKNPATGSPKRNGRSRAMSTSNGSSSVGAYSGNRLKSSTSSDDRMIPESNMGSTLASQNIQSTSPAHTARLAENLGINVTQRILRFHQQGPQPTSDPTLALQRQLARPLYQRPAHPSSSNGASTNKTRVIPTSPQRVLDAPGLIDDFYLNLVSWSGMNQLAVALCENTYIWSAETGNVELLGTSPDESYVSAVEFTPDGSFLGIAHGSGVVEVWDMETSTKLRAMSGHQAQVASLSWNNHILTSGCSDGSIWFHDVRVAQHKVMELQGHEGEVCGLKWRADGELLASGGNDNILNIWDGKTGSSGEGWRGTPKFTKHNHTAAVKAIAWCPWQTNLLATGGGTGDAQVHFWSSTTGARVNTLQTPAQVSSVHFSPHCREFMTTHGAPINAIMIHSYPSMSKVAEINDAHDARLLGSSVSPAGDVVCTYAGDENVKFWKVWEVPKKRKEKTGLGSANPSVRLSSGKVVKADFSNAYDNTGECDIFTGHDLQMNKIALKRFRQPEGGPSDSQADRIRREEDIWQKLQHPNILPFLGTADVEGTLYLVSPWVDNGSLPGYLKRNPNCDRPRLIRETASALLYLHQQNIIHGDVKATNILVSSGVHALLCDFGLSRPTASETEPGLKGLGGLRWQSPELWDGASKSFGSDVYAFAMTISEILTGKLPFSECSDRAELLKVMIRQRGRPPKDPNQSPDGSTDWSYVWDVAERCWAAEIEARPPVKEVLRWLEARTTAVTPTASLRELPEPTDLDEQPEPSGLSSGRSDGTGTLVTPGQPSQSDKRSVSFSSNETADQSASRGEIGPLDCMAPPVSHPTSVEIPTAPVIEAIA
ncbi:ubiquitin-protein transferase activating protein, partial [Tulasnella sp. 403]